MCGVGSLVYDSDGVVEIKPSACRAWSCETCAPARRAKCEIHARQGRPNKFFTLTSNPKRGASPIERRKLMGEAFPLLMRRWERRTGEKPEFNVIVEETKNGEPHFHVLMRAKYVHWVWLSKWWRELTGAKVVDIRAVKGTRGAARYISKYIGKGLHKFGTYKRYWSSRKWLLPPEAGDQAELWIPKAYRWTRDAIDDVVLSYRVAGWWRVPGVSRDGTIHLLWRLSRPPAPPRPPRK